MGDIGRTGAVAYACIPVGYYKNIERRGISTGFSG